MCRGSASPSASSVVSEVDTDSLGGSWLFFSLWERRSRGLHSCARANGPSAGQGAMSPAARSLPYGEQGVLPELTNGS